MSNSYRRRFLRWQRAEMFLAQNGTCANCGAVLGDSWHADHVHPYSLGGETELYNGQALCVPCNLRKGKQGMRPREWQDRFFDVYEQFKEKVFLLHAVPGSGKTFVIGRAGQGHLHKEEVTAMLALVPTVSLLRQTAGAIAWCTEGAVQLNPNWEGDTPLVGTKYVGAVRTYAWVYRNVETVRKWLSREQVFVVLDEVHHLQESLEWGRSVQRAVEGAVRVLLTTGTPFRSDGQPISLIPYVPASDGSGQRVAKLHFSHGYGKALRALPLQDVRAIYFDYQGGVAEWIGNNGKRSASFDDDLDEQGQSARLRTFLQVDTKHCQDLRRKGYRKLQALRQYDPDAAMLIFAMDQKHARMLKERMWKEFGINALIAISDDPASSDILNTFNAKGCQEMCLIVVKQASEGYDCPRIRVIVYATNYVTQLFFDQAIARGGRVESDHKDHTAFVFMPGDPRLVRFAKEYEKDREAALRERQEREGTEGGTREASIFIPKSATSEPLGIIASGQLIPPGSVDFASELITQDPHLGSLHPEALARAFLLAGFKTPERAISQQEEEQVEPHYVVIEKLREDNKKLVNLMCMQYKWDFQEVNNALNKAVGIWSVKNTDRVDVLERRLEIARSWFTTGARE